MKRWSSSFSRGCRRIYLHLKLLYSLLETLKNKEFMKWLKDEKFDIAFPHMYSLCAVGLVKAANIPTWIWLNRFLN